MNLLEAQKIAEKHLQSIQSSCPVEIDFNYEVTEEFPVGFVFYYNSKEYWDTKDLAKSLAGNGPLLVKRDSGELITLPSNQGVRRSLRELGLLEQCCVVPDTRMGPNAGPQFPETFTVHRVEGVPNRRINIDVDGTVSLVPDNTNKIWLNFGQTDRATSYLARKVDAGLPGAELKSFEVNGGFVLKLRQNAVPEKFARQNPNSPIISADPFPDQFAIP